MRWSQAGFTLVEMAIATFLGAIVAGSAATVTVYIVQNNQRSSDHMAAVYYAENAGHWLSQDGMMASNVSTDNLTSAELVELKWTTWNQAGDSIYHEVTYSITGLNSGVGELKRVQQDSTGTVQQAVVTGHIYYDTSHPDSTTMAQYQDSVLNLRVVTQVGQSRIIREYKVGSRPSF